MDFFDLAFWQSVVSNFCATIVGAFLGVFLALIFDKRREKSTEKKQKSKILKMLHDELVYNQKIIKVYNMKFEQADSVEIRNYTWTMDANLKVEAWQSFSDSGDLQWINDPDLLRKISDAYHFIGSVSTLSEKYFQLNLTQSIPDSEISGWTIRQMKVSLDEAIGLVDDIVQIALEQIDIASKQQKGWLARFLKRK